MTYVYTEILQKYISISCVKILKFYLWHISKIHRYLFLTVANKLSVSFSTKSITSMQILLVYLMKNSTEQTTMPALALSCIFYPLELFKTLYWLAISKCIEHTVEWGDCLCFHSLLCRRSIPNYRVNLHQYKFAQVLRS